jgi:hypothetical protein
MAAAKVKAKASKEAEDAAAKVKAKASKESEEDASSSKKRKVRINPTQLCIGN